MNRKSGQIFTIIFIIGGFLGFLGFIPKFNGEPNYFFFIFFSFFSIFLYKKISKEMIDERLLKNKALAREFMMPYYIISTFIILFLLDRNVSRYIPQLVGVILFAISFFLYPLLILWLDRKGDSNINY